MFESGVGRFGLFEYFFHFPGLKMNILEDVFKFPLEHF